MELDWEQKLQALQALGETHLSMRKPGDWYVALGDAHKHDGCFTMSIIGSGINPVDAVNNTWEEVTNIQLENGVAIKVGYGSDARFVVWNGFMWQDVTGEFKYQKLNQK